MLRKGSRRCPGGGPEEVQKGVYAEIEVFGVMYTLRYVLSTGEHELRGVRSPNMVFSALWEVPGTWFDAVTWTIRGPGSDGFMSETEETELFWS